MCKNIIALDAKKIDKKSIQAPLKNQTPYFQMVHP